MQVEIQTVSRRDPIKNYFPLPNEIYRLDLSAGAIAVYGYLLCIENRETYQAQAGYKTIGRAVKMSTNTVAKYVRGDHCLCSLTGDEKESRIQIINKGTVHDQQLTPEILRTLSNKYFN